MIPLDSLPDTDLATSRLAVRINMALLKMYRLQQQLESLQHDVSTFLDEYLGAVAKHLDKYLSSSLVSLHDDKHMLLENTAPSEQMIVMEKLMKQLYRQLASKCHPDINPEIASSTMISINQAYDNKELGSLILLSHTLKADSINFSKDDLTHYHQEIVTINNDLEEKIATLKESDANILRKDMLLARLNGLDVIANVADTLRKRICMV